MHIDSEIVRAPLFSSPDVTEDVNIENMENGSKRSNNSIPLTVGMGRDGRLVATETNPSQSYSKLCQVRVARLYQDADSVAENDDDPSTGKVTKHS